MLDIENINQVEKTNTINVDEAQLFQLGKLRDKETNRRSKNKHL